MRPCAISRSGGERSWAASQTTVGPCTVPKVAVAAELLLAAPAHIAAATAAVSATSQRRRTLRLVLPKVPCISCLPHGCVARFGGTLPRLNFRRAHSGSWIRRSGTRPVLCRSGHFSAQLGPPWRGDGGHS